VTAAPKPSDGFASSSQRLDNSPLFASAVPCAATVICHNRCTSSGVFWYQSIPNVTVWIRSGAARRRGRCWLLIIDAVAKTAIAIRHAALPHHVNAECQSANEGFDDDDDL